MSKPKIIRYDVYRVGTGRWASCTSKKELARELSIMQRLGHPLSAVYAVDSTGLVTEFDLSAETV